MSGAPPDRFHHAVFGGTLASPIPFPELRRGRAPDGPTWRFVVDYVRSPPVGPIRGRNVAGLTFHEAADGSSAGLFGWGDTGWYSVSHSGTEIVWYPGADRRPDVVRSVVLGPALALCLELDGVLCLHASAVDFGEGVVSFLAPKHHGKSTLALALLAAGIPLVSDDSVAVEPGPPAIVRPGVPSLRYDANTEAHFAGEDLPGTAERGHKVLRIDLPDEAKVVDPRPLSCCYLLRPQPETRIEAAERTLLDQVEAALVLNLNAKLTDPLTGLTSAGRRLTAAARLARSVPVFALDLVRDLSRLDEVVARLLAWHARTDVEVVSR